MDSESLAVVAMVSNPKPYTNFEDHQAGMVFRISDLIEVALKEGENPAQLLKEYLGVSCYTCNGVEEIFTVVMSSDYMACALKELRENWSNHDKVLDGDYPKLSSKGYSQKQAEEIFSKTTLRTYLESLSNLFCI